MQLVWCNRRLHREKHLLSDHRSTSSVWGSQHHPCSCFQRSARQSLVTPCLLAQPLGNFTLHTKARESTDQPAPPQKTTGFAFLITGDWLINGMNSIVLPLWREWWHSESLPGKRLLFPIPPTYGRQAQVKKGAAHTLPSYHWEARDYPQQTGCKQWLSPWGKSKGQQQFQCFMAREKSTKCLLLARELQRPRWYSPDDTTTGNITKRVLQREKEQQWPIPHGRGSHPTAL